TSSGAGWAAAWEVQNSNVVVPGYQMQANSLTYGNLQTLGNTASGGYLYLTAGRRLATADGGVFDDYVAQNQNGIGTTTGGDIWLSGALRKEINNSETIFLTFHDNNIAWCSNCTNNQVAWGYFGASSDVNGQKMWSVRLGTTVYPTAIPVVIGTAAFFAMHLTFTASGTQVEVYVNPTLATVPANPTFSQTTSNNFVIRSVAAYMGSTVNNGSVDEIRIAKTYPCVAPDNTVAVDLPPTANFSMSVNSGTSPVSVNLNGTASSDPENAALTYSWNFGDGTPPVIGQTTLSHSFSPLGQLSVSLTVTDPAGQSHTQYQTLTVYDQNGTYPCLNTFTLVNEADCGQNNGILRINTPPTSFALFDGNNVAQTLTGANEFQNLASGTYTYISSGGVGGCKDTFQLHIPTDSSTCAAWSPSDCQMDIGVNLSGLADWAFERPFKNLFLHVREEPIPYHDNCNCWDNGVLSEIQTDAAGYPLQIPQATTASPTTYIRMVISSNGGNLQDGKTYVLLYDGIGTITMQGGINVISSAPNRIEFQAVGSGNMWFHLTASQLGNHVRNIRLLRLADEFADLQAEPFYEGFLKKVAPFYSFRFMDWGHTNGSPHIAWQDRTTTDKMTYSGLGGVPYEMMAALGNATNKNIWVCVPHQADDNYITEMAKLFRDHLNPNLTLYLEYSNEVWNWMFSQAHYNNDTKPSNLGYGAAYAEKAKHTFEIWHSVFGNQKHRVKRVLGLQAGYNGLNEQILAQLSQKDWDYASPTFYYGLDHGNTGNPVLTASATPLNVLQNSANAFTNFAPYVHQDYRNTKLFGKGIVNYEGGQHFTDFTQPPYLQAMYDAQILPEMYDLYDEVLDSIRYWGSEMAMAFTLAAARESIYGSWGHLEDIDQDTSLLPAPKFQALMDNLAQHQIPAITGDMSIDVNGVISFPLEGTYYANNLTGSGFTYSWSVENGQIMGANNLDSVRVTWALADTGTLHLWVTEAGGCGGTTQIVGLAPTSIALHDVTIKTFQIYPNPSEGRIFLTHHFTQNQTAYLLNSLGMIVQVFEIQPTTKEINIENLPSGLYFLRVGNCSERVVLR
ncbi:MAG: PKD domain-containing protein, partial [Bacteroidia bacterium]